MTEDIRNEPELERLLSIARDEQPDPAVADAHWAALSARLGGGGPPGTGAGAAAKSAAAPSLTKGKLFGLGLAGLLAVGLLGLATQRVTTSPTPAVAAAPNPTPQASLTPPAEPQLDVEPGESLEPVQTGNSPEPETAPDPPGEEPELDVESAAVGAAATAHHGAPKSKAVPRSASAPSSCPDLAAEVALLGEIQAQFQAQQAKQALETISRWRRDCKSPNLSEEVLAVELLVLCDLGREKRARVRAEQFVSRWPKSTLQHRLVNSCVAGELR